MKDPRSLSTPSPILRRLALAVPLALLAGLLASPGVLLAQDPADPKGKSKNRQDDDRIVVRERAVIVDGDGDVIKWKSDDGPIVFDHSIGPRHRRFLIDALPGRGYLGVQVTELTPELRLHFGAPEEAGVMVAKVLEDSPAERAGIQVGDILTEIGAEAITSSWSLTHAVRSHEAGERLALRLWRAGEPLDFEVEVAEHERKRLHLLADRGPKGFDLRIVGVPELDQARIHVPEALGRAAEYFDSQEWKDKARRLKELDWEGIEQRMQALERRLRELEAEVEGDIER